MRESDGARARHGSRRCGPDALDGGRIPVPALPDRSRRQQPLRVTPQHLLGQLPPLCESARWTPSRRRNSPRSSPSSPSARTTIASFSFLGSEQEPRDLDPCRREPAVRNQIGEQHHVEFQHIGRPGAAPGVGGELAVGSEIIEVNVGVDHDAQIDLGMQSLEVALELRTQARELIFARVGDITEQDRIEGRRGDFRRSAKSAALRRIAHEEERPVPEGGIVTRRGRPKCSAHCSANAPTRPVPPTVRRATLGPGG